jgi:two-component system response regulator FixJ
MSAQMRFYCSMHQRDQDPHELTGSAVRSTVVYVVDDDRDVLGSLRFLLETDGFKVRTFLSAAALFNGMIAGEADCFVLDYKMPGLSGIDLAKRLRSRLVGTPIVLITGYPDLSIEEKAAAAGIGHVLLKPHLEESLISRIRIAIEQGQSTG